MIYIVCFFKKCIQYLFSLYRDDILRELETLTGFNIGARKLKNIRDADDTTLIADSDTRLKDLLDKSVEKKG